MPFSFIYSSVTPLNRGYDCVVPVPVDQIASRVRIPDATVVVTASITCEGEVVDEREITIEPARNRGEHALQTFDFRYSDYAGLENVPFLEIATREKDGKPAFASRRALSFYTVFHANGKKTFFSDNNYKFGTPTVIEQIARFSKFVEGMAVVRVSRSKNLGETVTIINPYKMPVLAAISANDGRSLPRVRIPAMSVRQVNLGQFLRDDEDEWSGHIQITAKNRVILFQLKHAFDDLTLVTDQEHSDSFRADPTHMPLFRKVKNFLGNRWYGYYS